MTGYSDEVIRKQFMNVIAQIAKGGVDFKFLKKIWEEIKVRYYEGDVKILFQYSTYKSVNSCFYFFYAEKGQFSIFSGFPINITNRLNL